MVIIKLLALVLLFASVLGNPAQDSYRGPKNVIQSDLLDSVYQDCLKKDTIACMKYKVLSFADKVIERSDEISVTEGVQIVKTGEVQGAPRSLSSDNTFEGAILGRIQTFLETHTVKFDISGKDILSASSDAARSLSSTFEEDEDEEEEARGKIGGKKKIKKIKKVIGPLIPFIFAKAMILAKLALLVIAFMAGKALIIGKIALAISAIIGLRKLFGGKGKEGGGPLLTESHLYSHETLHPAPEHGHGGWGRSLDAQEMAYRSQVPQ